MAEMQKEDATLPVPDPTSLTTASLLREIMHLRELLESRFTERDLRFQERFDEQNNALSIASKETAKAVTELEGSISRRIEGLSSLTDAKFVTYQSLLNSQADKVALALTAADKAVSKAESFNEKRFELMSAQIDDLKAYQQSTVGKGAGAVATWGYVAGAIGTIATLISIVVVIINFSQ